MSNLVPESEQQYGSILTVLGENAEQNGKLLNKQIEFTHIAFGDANDTYVQPDRKSQALVNELHRIPVNSVDVLQPTPDSVPILKVEAILPDNINDVVIREFAAVATFNGQTYFHAIGNCARIYVPKPLNNGNVSNPVILEMTFVITSAEPIVEVDPNVVTASREWTQQNTVISVDTFSQAYNGSVKAKRLRTNYHTNFGRGGSEYIYIDTDTTKKSQGDEYEFWNAAGHHYRLNHNRTISIEQFGAVDDNDIMPVLAKVLPLFKSGVLRIKSEGGDYRLAPGSITIDDCSASELDLRKANLRIDESLDKSTRITFNNPTSLEIKMNEVDYEGTFSHRLFDINNPKRLRVRVYDEIKNACYPSPDYVVDNLSAFMIVSGGSDIRIKFTEFFNMYHKNYDGTLVDRWGAGGEHLGRCISAHKLQGVASKRLRLSGGAVTECRTPFVFDGCDNLTAKSIDFTQLSDNAIYDLSCNNTVYDDMTFVECQDEGIVFSGVNKKFRALRFYNVSNKCAAINGYIKAVSFDSCSFRANSGDMPLNAIKTRTEVAVQSKDLTVSNCYFEGRVDYAVNYLQKIDKVSFNNKCRFVIEDNVNGRAIATFGDVGLLEVGNSDFVITGTAAHNRIVSVVGDTKLRTYDNEGLLENYLSYPEGGKLPVEFRDKNNIDPSTFTTVEEHKGNAHFVAPVTGGLEGRGYTMSFAFDSNVNSYDEIQTGGFIRVVKSDSNNVEADCRFEFWSAKSDKTGYELVGVIDNQNPLLPAEEPVA